MVLAYRLTSLGRDRFADDSIHPFDVRDEAPGHYVESNKPAELLWEKGGRGHIDSHLSKTFSVLDKPNFIELRDEFLGPAPRPEFAGPNSRR